LLLSVMVVEDEAPARRGLIRSVERSGLGSVVGEAGDGVAAIRLLHELKPNVVLLDINLPGESGLEVARQAPGGTAIVFVTAYDQHAIAAFELSAIDYLLKPVSDDRLARALDRVRLMAPEERAHTREQLTSHPLDQLTTFFVRDKGQIIALHIEEVVRLEADDMYVAMYARGRKFLVQLPLAEIEKRLPPGSFVRVHRSHIVSLREIVKLSPYDAGRLTVELRDGDKLIASRTCSKLLRTLVLG